MHKKIVLVVGARPNFVKAYSVYQKLKTEFDVTLIHTGQHYSENMSDVFFDEFSIKPDISLKINQKTKAGNFDQKLYLNNIEYLKDKNIVIEELLNYSGDLGQLGEMRDGLVDEFQKLKPDLVFVFGDVTSSLSASLAAKKLSIKLAHVESGLRSNDLSMPEEVNRILVDYICDYHFITEQSGFDNLRNEKPDNSCLYFVGNTMIDCLVEFKDIAEKKEAYKFYNLTKKDYVLITLHRPSNVDNEEKLKEIIKDIIDLSNKEKIVFCMHPRTKNNLEKFNIDIPNTIIIEAPSYLNFLSLIINCKYVITDSGGIQEETSFLNIPCFTLRESTERPITLCENSGTNILINKIVDLSNKICLKDKTDIFLWDGKSADRIVNYVHNHYGFKYIELCDLSLIKDNNGLNNNNTYYDNIHYSFNDLNFLYRTKKNKNLIIFFHAATNEKTRKPVFYFFHENNIGDCDSLCFSDPSLNINDKIKCTWFMPTSQYDSINMIKDVMIKIKDRYDNVICYGTSAGGLISVIIASIFKFNALVGNSQFYLKPIPGVTSGYSYIPILNKDFGIDLDIDIEDFLIKHGLPKKMYVYQNVYDEVHFKNQYTPFKNFVEKNFSNNYEFVEFTTDVPKAMSYDPDISQYKNSDNARYKELYLLRDEVLGKHHGIPFPSIEKKYEIIKKILL